MIHYFYGEDTYQARQAIGELAAKKKAAICWLDKESFQAKGVADWLGQQTGLFGATLPVVREVSRLAASTQTEIADYLEQHGKLDVVLWDRAKTRRLPPLPKGITKQQFASPSSTQLSTWLVDAVRERGGTINSAAANSLIQRVGTNRYALLGIIEKMLLTTQAITTSEVDVEADSVQAAEIFTTLTAILNHRPKEAIASVTTLLNQGHSELYVLSMLAWQFKILVQVKQGATSKLKPFVVKKSLPYVQAVSADQLLDTLTKLLATDWAIKQGKIEARTALMMTVLGLVRA